MDKNTEKQLQKAIDNRGKGDIADAIGMPDEKDYQELLKIFQRFEKRYPGLIRYGQREGRRDFDTGIHRRNLTFKGKALVNKESEMEYVFELPALLKQEIETTFPSLFRSRKHFNWFKRNFHKLTISGQET